MTTVNKKIKWAAVRFVSPSPHNLKPLHPVPSFRNANAPAPIPTLDTVPHLDGSQRVLEVDIYTADNGIMMNYCLSDDEARCVLVEREIKYHHQGGKRLYRLCFDDCINVLARRFIDAHPRTWLAAFISLMRQLIILCWRRGMTHYKQSPKHTPRTPQHAALNKQALFNSKCGVRISLYTNNGSYEQALKNLSKHLPLAVEVFAEPSLMLLACAAHGELDTVLDTPYSLKDVKPQNVPRTPHALLNVLGFVYATVPLTGELITDWREVLRAYASSSTAAMVYCSRQGFKGVAFGELPLIVRQLCSHSMPTRQLVQVLTGRQGTKRRNRFLGERQARQPPVLYRVASYTYELEHKPFKTAEPFLGRSLLHFIEQVEHCRELVTLGGEYGEMTFNKLTYTLTI